MIILSAEFGFVFSDERRIYSMQRKYFPIMAILTASIGVIMLMGFFNMTVLADEKAEVEQSTVLADPVPATIITVTSGLDPDNSKSTECADVGVAECTLRRAIVEARDSAKPVLIRFNIPEEVSEGYDSQNDIWKIQTTTTSDNAVFRRLNGQIMIDGSTQPGGRGTGPKIVIIGPSVRKAAFIVGDVAGDNDHIIRGLAFQNFDVSIYVNHDNNLIENNWFGLSDDGTTPDYFNDEEDYGSGDSGIALLASASNNQIQNNVFLGLYGVAAAIRGDLNTFSMNFVGTAADGTVPGKETDPNLICKSVDWLGGGGITVDGDDHTIDSNIFAGLRQDIFSISTPPSAIQVGGDGHTISNNQIGVDSADNQVGVCGRGIYLISDPENNQVTTNTIVYPGLSGISLNGALYDANTLRSNTIKARSEWTQIEGNAKPEDAIQLGAGLPDAFEYFLPAKVTDIDGTSVKGESGTGSPCPNCVIELFLDDTDVVTEALKSLAVVNAGSDGKWTATIGAISENQGIRTTSTTVKFGTIPNMDAGTTTGLSILYTKGGGNGEPGDGNQLYLPLVVNKD
jgi:parallel beta-helix repeat protein